MATGGSAELQPLQQQKRKLALSGATAVAEWTDLQPREEYQPLRSEVDLGKICWWRQQVTGCGPG